jgi:hypothetical protein
MARDPLFFLPPRLRMAVCVLGASTILKPPSNAPRATAEATMRKLNSFKAKARALARSGYFYGLPPLEFELSFEEGFKDAREWLDQASTREELERLCIESRAKHKAA